MESWDDVRFDGYSLKVEERGGDMVGDCGIVEASLIFRTILDGFSEKGRDLIFLRASTAMTDPSSSSDPSSSVQCLVFDCDEPILSQHLYRYTQREMQEGWVKIVDATT